MKKFIISFWEQPLGPNLLQPGTIGTWDLKPFAPMGPNIFMAGMEKIFFDITKIKPLLWFRYQENVLHLDRKFPKTQRVLSICKLVASNNHVYNGVF